MLQQPYLCLTHELGTHLIIYSTCILLHCTKKYFRLPVAKPQCASCKPDMGSFKFQSGSTVAVIICLSRERAHRTVFLIRVWGLVMGLVDVSVVVELASFLVSCSPRLRLLARNGLVNEVKFFGLIPQNGGRPMKLRDHQLLLSTSLTTLKFILYSSPFEYLYFF